MAEMIELKRKPKEEPKAEAPMSSGWPNEEYPVSMYLDNDQLDQLGLKTLEVGKEMTITCKVKVRSFSSSETDQGAQKSASLSVMAMGVMPEGKSAAETLYGKKEVADGV